MKILAKIKKCSNLQLDLKLMIFRLFLNFLTPVLVVRISNFMMVKSYPQNVKPGEKAKLLAIDQFFMYLSWLRNGFITRMLSRLFYIAKSTVSRYLVTWTSLLYFSLGKSVIWPSKVQVLDTMPETFKTAYP